MMKKIIAFLIVAVSFLSASAQKITADQVKFTDNAFSKVVEMSGTAREIYNIAFCEFGEDFANKNNEGNIMYFTTSLDYDISTNKNLSNHISISYEISFYAKTDKYRIKCNNILIEHKYDNYISDGGTYDGCDVPPGTKKIYYHNDKITLNTLESKYPKTYNKFKNEISKIFNKYISLIKEENDF